MARATLMTQPLHIDAAGRTDPGRQRTRNEDHFLIGQLDKSLLVSDSSLPPAERVRLVGAPEGQVLCVADGLGGHSGGERASSTAMEAVVHYLLHTMPCFYRARQVHDDQLRSELGQAVEMAARAVNEAAKSDSSLAGMGTTLTLAFLQWPALYVLHVGDSRCYLMRGALQQVTHDHTLAQKLLDDGTLKPDEAKKSRLSGALWNALGGGTDSMTIDLHKVPLEPGDTLLLCTDGLTGMVTDARIEAILKAATSAAEACATLVAEANAAGGTDNITVVVARIPETREPPAPTQVFLADDSPSSVERGPSITG